MRRHVHLLFCHVSVFCQLHPHFQYYDSIHSQAYCVHGRGQVHWGPKKSCQVHAVVRGILQACIVICSREEIGFRLGSCSHQVLVREVHLPRAVISHGCLFSGTRGGTNWTKAAPSSAITWVRWNNKSSRVRWHWSSRCFQDYRLCMFDSKINIAYYRIRMFLTILCCKCSIVIVCVDS